MSPDITVVDMDSGRTIHPPSPTMRQVVVCVDYKDRTFTTMAVDGYRFRLQTFNLACDKLLERSIPVFMSGYCCENEWAFSRDGKRLVYLKGEPPDLCLLDVATEKETLLWKKIAYSSVGIKCLEWISESEVVAVAGNDSDADPSANVVVVSDTTTGRRRTVYEPTSPIPFVGCYSLSRDGSLLAFGDGNKRYDLRGAIKVLDIRSGTLRATLGNGTNSVRCPCWNPEGTELAYVDGPDLKVWSMADHATRTLRTFPEQFFCFRVALGGGKLGYVGGDPSAVKPLVILDSSDGKELRTVTVPFSGRMFLMPGNVLVSETGY
jgi:WD40 repeat protein